MCSSNLSITCHAYTYEGGGSCSEFECNDMFCGDGSWEFFNAGLCFNMVLGMFLYFCIAACFFSILVAVCGGCTQQVRARPIVSVMHTPGRGHEKLPVARPMVVQLPGTVVSTGQAQARPLPVAQPVVAHY